MNLRSNWKGIWNEAKEVAINLMMEIKYCQGRRRVEGKRQRIHYATSTTEASMAEMNDT